MPKGKYDPYKDVTWTRTPQPGDEILQSLPGRRGYGYKGPGAGEKISPGASPIAVQYATPPPGGINMVIPDQYTQRTAPPKSVPPGVQRFKEKENRRQVPVTAPKAKDPRRADKKREQRKQDVKKIMPDIKTEELKNDFKRLFKVTGNIEDKLANLIINLIILFILFVIYSNL